MCCQIFNGLNQLIDAAIKVCAGLFTVKLFTRSGLSAG